MNKILIAVLPFLLLTGCSSYVSRYFFDYKRTDNSSTEFIQKDETYARYKYYFEDDFIKLRTDCEPYGLGLYLSNKTDIAVRIIWDSVKVFSDYLKDSSISINHLNKSQDNIQIPDSTSSDFLEKNLLVNLMKEDSLSLIRPSIILANKNWMDEILLKQNNYLLPYQLSNKDLLDEKSSKVIGKQIKLILPIKINNVIKKYSFIFTVKDFQILSKG